MKSYGKLCVSARLRLNSFPKYCIWRKNNKIIGGFILGNRFPLRTKEYFVSPNNFKYFDSHIKDERFCEVCCFWISSKQRTKIIFNGLAWYQMAKMIKNQSKPFVLFGTNSIGLARMYGYPKCSLLFHKDKVNNKETFIFLVNTKDFLNGVLNLIYVKMLKGSKFNKEIDEITDKPKLKERLLNEISI